MTSRTRGPGRVLGVFLRVPTAAEISQGPILADTAVALARSPPLLLLSGVPALLSGPGHGAGA